ncbi:MAG: hypothetical protein ACI8TP_000547 [Acidimicrobiales bacterium]|jgi:hypothetical protein
MPGGSNYPGPATALELYRALVDSIEDGEIRGAKNPYTSRNGNMQSFLDAAGTMAIHLSPELEAEFRSQYESGPVIQHDRTMQGYSSVPTELLEDTEGLRQWFDRSWEWIGTLKPKPTKKPNAKKVSAKKVRGKTKAAG